MVAGEVVQVSPRRPVRAAAERAAVGADVVRAASHQNGTRIFRARAVGPNRETVSSALGNPARGIDGLRQSHQDAIDAARVARLGERRPGAVTAHRAVELPAPLSADVERARRFVREQLGRLAREDDETARLRATLLAYLEENGSRIATAERLGIHPNTVANRIRAYRELLDHDLSRRWARLQVALGLAASPGPAVLRGSA